MLLALDVGGTSIKIGVFENGLKESLRMFERINISGNFEGDINNIVDLVSEQNFKFEKLGIGVPGVLDKNSGRLLHATNLSYWVDQPFSEILKEKLNLELVVAQNDTLSAGRGEYYYGGTHDESFIFIIWGTGIGGCIIRQGEVDNNVTFELSELGHQIVVGQGLKCNCTQEGCLEAYIGGGSIRKRFNRFPRELNQIEWQEVHTLLSQGLVNVSRITGIEKFVFGGGVATKHPDQVMLATTMANSSYKGGGEIESRISLLGDRVGVYGALTLVL